jgi:predicted RNase H-like HicB family nuclease
MHRYEIITFWSNEDNTFIADVPELPGCKAHGDSPQEALNNAQEAISLWIDTAREFGDTVPEPKGGKPTHA